MGGGSSGWRVEAPVEWWKLRLGGGSSGWSGGSSGWRVVARLSGEAPVEWWYPVGVVVAPVGVVEAPVGGWKLRLEWW